MENSELVDKMLEIFVRFKKSHFFNDVDINGLGKSEKIILIIMHENNKEMLLLSSLREKMSIAPSTLTAIITSLEQKKLITRIIDKSDRRNIYIKLSKKGKEYTDMAHIAFKENIEKYIEYMGKEDVNEVIRLFSKTIDYIDERRDVK